MDISIEHLIPTSHSVIEFLMINSFYSLLLAVIVILLKLVYPKLPKSIEYGFWCVVLLRLILPNDLSFDYALINIIKSLFITSNSPELFTSQILSNIFNHDSANLKLNNTLFYGWLLIVCFISARYLSLRINLIKMLNRSHPVVEYWPVRCANRWRLSFWIKHRVIIIAADKFLSPFTFSFVNPVIFIPRKILETKNEPLIESIIAHEMAHIKRQDSLWLALQNVIQILYFFNPLVWLVVRQLSSLRESLCDDMVLSVDKVKPEDYGNSLLQVLRFNISGDNHSLLPAKFLGHKNQIKNRISAIGNYTLSQHHPYLRICLVLTFALFLLPISDNKQADSKQLTNKEKSYKIDTSPFPKSVKDDIKLPTVERSNRD